MSASLIEQLTKLFRAFPGIGSRQARRFVYFLLQQDDAYVRELMQLITQSRKHMHLCQESFQFFYDDNPSEVFSPLVRNPSRSKETLMIVLKDMDLESIEKSNVYQGQYFVLGGLAPMIATQGHGTMRSQELLNIIRKRAEGAQSPLREIILALPLTTEGEHTRQTVQNLIEPLAQKYSIKISTLGRGLSTGTELEYIDHDTLASALEGRK
jgi:recombination protein RecR